MAAAVAPSALAAGESHSAPNSEQKLADFVKQLTALRNDVFAGTHPRLKLPAHIGDKGRPLSGVTASSLPGLSNGFPIPPPPVGPVPPQASATTPYNTAAFRSNAIPQHASVLPPSTSGIDPIFLQKSDTLVRAEAHAKRDRLEHVLEEQAKLKKTSLKHKTHDEFAMPEFSIDEVLQKAYTLAPPSASHRDGPANGGQSSTDSFDDNTFYSSQMNESTSTEGEVIEEPKRHVRLKLCRFFLNDKPCPYGDSCSFSHDPSLRAKVDGTGPGPYARDPDGTNQKEDPSLRNKSPPRPVQKKGRDGKKNDQTAVTEPTSQQQRIAQLEAELEAMKAKEAQQQQVHQQNVSSTQSRKPQPVMVGPDEFGRDLSLRDEIFQPNDETRQQDPRRDREYGRHDRNLISPLAHDVQVVRNHITSPQAPQPSRISPQAVAKLSRLNQNQADGHRISRIPYAEVVSDGSPNVSVQPLSSRKRRRGRDADENNRNVVPRNGNSPLIRIKDEPVSPPPFQEAPPRRVSGQDAARPVYVDVASRSEERMVRKTRNSDRPGDHYETQLLEPTMRRVVSRNGQHYFANDEPDLRRVVSERQMRAPVSPMPRHVASPYTDPRIARATSQAYISPTGKRPHIDYRASAQPQNISYGRSPSPIMRNMSPIGPPAPLMAPPRRRVVVDQYGNEFLESEVRQASVAPIQRPHVYPEYDEPGARVVEQRYTSVIPQVEPRYEPQRPVDMSSILSDNDRRTRSQFRNRPSSPASPTFLDYSRPVRVIRQPDPTDVEASYAREYPSSRIVYQENHPGPIYEPHQSQRDGAYPVQHLRPVEDRYERISRVPSVQPRAIQVTERQPMSPAISRQASVHPRENFDRPEAYARPEIFRGQYDYAPQTEPIGGYYREAPPNAGYETPRRII